VGKSYVACALATKRAATATLPYTRVPAQTSLKGLILPPGGLAINEQRHSFLQAELGGLFALGHLAPGLRHAVQPHGFQFFQSRVR